MDFWQQLSTGEKVIIGVAVATLVVALFLYFTSKNKQNETMTADHSSHSNMPHHSPPPTPSQRQPSTPLTTNISGSGGQKTLVMFYATWCGYCKGMMPDWDRFAQQKNGYNNVKIIKVESTEQPAILKKHQVPGFPLVRYCPNGLNELQGAVTYQGDRSVEDLTRFLQEVSA